MLSRTKKALPRDNECPIANHAENLKAMVSTEVVFDTEGNVYVSVSQPESRQRQLITSGDIETPHSCSLEKRIQDHARCARYKITNSFHWQVTHARKTHTSAHTEKIHKQNNCNRVHHWCEKAKICNVGWGIIAVTCIRADAQLVCRK